MSLQIFTATIQDLKRNVAINLMSIGAALKTVRDDSLWEGEHESFNAYLGSPEVSFSRSWALQIIRVYEIFGNRVTGVNDLDKLYLISNVVEENPNEAEEWLGKAQTLSRSDLRDEVRAKAGKEPRHSLSIHDKAKYFLDTIQPEDYWPDRRTNDWEPKFKKLLIDFHNWKLDK